MVDVVTKTIVTISLDDCFVTVQGCAHRSIADRMGFYLEASRAS